MIYFIDRGTSRVPLRGVLRPEQISQRILVLLTLVILSAVLSKSSQAQDAPEIVILSRSISSAEGAATLERRIEEVATPYSLRRLNLEFGKNSRPDRPPSGKLDQRIDWFEVPQSNSGQTNQSVKARGFYDQSKLVFIGIFANNTLEGKSEESSGLLSLRVPDENASNTIGFRNLIFFNSDESRDSYALQSDGKWLYRKSYRGVPNFQNCIRIRSKVQCTDGTEPTTRIGVSGGVAVQLQSCPSPQGDVREKPFVTSTSTLQAGKGFLLLEAKGSDGTQRNIMILRDSLIVPMTKDGSPYEEAAKQVAGMLHAMRGGQSMDRASVLRAGRNISNIGSVNRYSSASELLKDLDIPSGWNEPIAAVSWQVP